MGIIDLSVLKLSSNFEVLFYTIFLLLIWMLLRFFASRISSIVSYFGAQRLKVDPHLNGVTFPVSYWTEKGGRPYQEDRFYMMKANGEDSSLYGVFDGHGGHQAAQYCKDYLLQCIASDPDWEQSPPKAITRSFIKLVSNFISILIVVIACLCRVDAEFSGKARAQMLNDGTTAIVAAFHGGKIYVANGEKER